MRNEFLLAFTLKGTFVLAAAFGVNAALRRASASARHLVWTVAFTALLLLPLLSQVTPTWNAPLPVSHNLRVQSVTATSRIPAAMPSELAQPTFEWIFSIWLLGATLVFSRFLAGTIRVWFKVRRASPMRVAGVSDKVRLLDVGPAAMPMTWGVLHLVVLLPDALPIDRPLCQNGGEIGACFRSAGIGQIQLLTTDIFQARQQPEAKQMGESKTHLGLAVRVDKLLLDMHGRAMAQHASDHRRDF